jgi:hypothetical protein
VTGLRHKDIERRANRAATAARPPARLVAGDQHGEAAYDPFLGSGTTLVAAERLSRRCDGMELDPRDCDVILTRWERFSGQSAARVNRAAAAT